MPRPLIPIPWIWSGTSNGKGIRISLPMILILTATPIVVLPATYLGYMLRQATRRTTATTSIAPPDSLLPTCRHRRRLGTNTNGEKDEEEEEEIEKDSWEGGDTLAIPSHILAAPEKYVISRERIVSEAVPLWRISPVPLLRPEEDGEEEVWRDEEEDARNEREKGREKGAGRRGLLETYLAATMRTFTWTPQALIMKMLVARLPDGDAHAATFSKLYLAECRFEIGDRVCGVYVVRRRIHIRSGGERVMLELSPPEGWRGPVVGGMLDCGFVIEQRKGRMGGGKRGDDEGVETYVRFVNETVLWRRRDDEPPTLLEGVLSRRLHTLMVGWMMVRGVEAVTIAGDGGGVKVKMS